MMIERQNVDIDAYADAPAPALQRAIGGRPWLSAVVLIVVYVVIGIRTGLGAYRFPRTDDPGRTGILLAWLSIMALLAIGLWALWASSRLRWYQIRLRQSAANSDLPEVEKLLRSAHRLVEISHRVRPMVGWAIGLAVTAGLIGLGLVVVFFPHQPG